MRRSTAAALLAILLLAVFMRLLPLLRFVYWGSDVGEYHRLAAQLVAGGHLGTDYNGWGSTYPYFPGFYFVVGGADLVNIGLGSALNLIPPVLNALAVLLVFLIAVRIFRDERVGIVAAGVLAVSMPYVYTNSHPIPSTIGSVLVLAALALVVGPSQASKKNLVLLFPLSAALVLTHHLSTYFLMIAVLFSLVLKSLSVTGFRWRSVAPELALLAFLFSLALPYWLVYATPFRVNLLGDLGTMPWWGPFGLLLAGLSLWIVLVTIRQRSQRVLVPRYPTLRRSRGLFLVALAFTFGLTITFIFVNVPGTSIKLPPVDVLFLSPFLVLAALAVAGRKVLDFSHDGHKPTAWFIVFTLSMLAGSVIGARILIPYRHMDYLMIPVAVMIGAGLALFHDLAFAGRKRGFAVALAVTFLIVGNIPVAYPPPEIMAGYDEGASSHSLVAISWLPGHVNGLLATDHKASTLAFGFGKTNATWDTARWTLIASNFSNAKGEMINVSSPSGHKRVDYALMNVEVRSGTQLFPWEPAYKLSGEAQGKFNDLPFQRFYDDGYTQVYYVNWGLA